MSFASNFGPISSRRRAAAGPPPVPTSLFYSILNNAPEFYYRMDEEEFIPEVYDYSWNIRDAVGSVDFAGLGGWIPDFTGSRGGRLFNSTVDTYVLCPDPYPGVHDVSFTICMIATRVGAPDPGQERSLLGRGYNASGTDWSVECTHDSNNAVIFRLVTTTGGVVERTCQTADGVMTIGAQMFHFVWEAGVGARIYRNGALAASISFTEGNLRASANQNWILGKSRRIDTANGYHGAMSDVALFSSPLSPAIIAGQWDGRNTLEVFTPRSLPGIRGWFDFSDGTSITEISGKVAQIDHQSPGSSMFASDALDANRPLYVVEPGSGLNVGRGTGTQNLSFSQPFVPISNTIPSGRGYCCVIGGNEDPTFGTIFLSSTDTQNYYLDLEPGGFLYVSVSNTLRTLSGLANTSDGSLHMMLHSVTPAGWELRYDTQTSSGPATTWTQINAIGNYQSAPFRLHGSVGEIVIGVAPLTQFMKDELYNYADAKWNITGAWSPASLSPAAWFDPSSPGARTVDGSTLVERLTDLSGNGRDLYNALTGTLNRPDFLTDQWVTGAFATPSSEGLLYQGPALTMTEYTIYMVGYIGTDDAQYRGFIPMSNGDVSAAATSRAMLYAPTVAGTPEFQICNGNSPSFKYAETLTPIPGNIPIGKHIFKWKQTSTMAACVFQVDNVVVPVAGSSGPAPSAVTFTQLGMQSGFNGGVTGTWQYGEIIIVPRITNAGEDAAAENYLRTKWGTP